MLDSAKIKRAVEEIWRALKEAQTAENVADMLRRYFDEKVIDGIENGQAPSPEELQDMADAVCSNEEWAEDAKDRLLEAIKALRELLEPADVDTA